jgi:isopenicillin N synthase-like dioxygenase
MNSREEVASRLLHSISESLDLDPDKLAQVCNSSRRTAIRFIPCRWRAEPHPGFDLGSGAVLLSVSSAFRGF